MKFFNDFPCSQAITMQRVFRGYVGKLKASEVRAEMAEFIAMIRSEEAGADEEDYWRTHNIARIRRDIGEFFEVYVKGRQENQAATNAYQNQVANYDN